MQIIATRDVFTESSTTATVTIDGVPFGYILEPPAAFMGGKGHLIPAGTYAAILRWSPKNHAWVIQLLDVPGHTDIEWHIGNKPQDTDGCACVGLSREGDYLSYSADAFELLWRRIVTYLPHQNIAVTYIDAPGEVGHVHTVTA